MLVISVAQAGWRELRLCYGGGPIMPVMMRGGGGPMMAEMAEDDAMDTFT